MGVHMWSDTFRIGHYPAGEPYVALLSEDAPPGSGDTLVWPCRDWNDLVCMVTAAETYPATRFFVPYMPFLRADKGNHSDASMVFDLTASAPNISTVNPHSALACGLIPNTAFLLYARTVVWELDALLGGPVLFIHPDSGAGIRNNGDLFALDGHDKATARRREISATKTRHPKTGRITDYRIDGGVPDDSTGVGVLDSIVVVDDIIDGGATFLSLSKEINSLRGKSPGTKDVVLIATHGILSGDIAALCNAYDIVICMSDNRDRIAAADQYENLHVLSALEFMKWHDSVRRSI